MGPAIGVALNAQAVVPARDQRVKSDN